MTAVDTGARVGTGNVWIWGDNAFSQQCDGTTESRLLPAMVEGIGNVVTIGGGGGHGVVLRTDGTVWAWGRNDHGQAGDGGNSNRSTPAKVEGLEGIVALAGGGGHSLAMDADGTVWAWGHNGRGDLGDGTTDNRSRPVRVQGLTDVAALSWGGGHGARTADGTVWAWGRNDRGQIGDGGNETRLSPVRVVGLEDVRIDRVVGGYFHSLALDSDGRLWTWGNNDSGQLGDGTMTNRGRPLPVAGLPPVVAVAGGGGRNEFGPGGHTMALLADGTVRAWGLNDAGQLGDGTTENRTHPVEVLGLAGVTDIVAAGGYSMALA